MVKSKKKLTLFILVVLLLSLLLSACDLGGPSTVETKQTKKVNDQQQHYQDAQPIPWFDYSLELYMMEQMYVARNNAVTTYSIVFNPYLGQITFECASIGYPIPGGTQVDNPYQVYSNSTYWAVTLGQAEPNGLYPPANSSGTYVMCLNSDGTIGPAYVEPEVMTFPTPMQLVDHKLVPVPGKKSSVGFSSNPATVVTSGASSTTPKATVTPSK